MNQQKTKRIKLGFTLVLIWCLVSAFSRVFTGAVEQKISPIALCFYTTLCSLIFFILLIKNHKEIFHKALARKKEIIVINLATTGCWLFLFFPLKYLEPSIVGALTLCITPIATLIIGRLIYQQQTVNKHDYAISIFTFLVALYLMAIGFFGHTAIKFISTTNNMLSIFCCIVVSGSLALSNIYAKKLNNSGFIPLEILAVRFVLLVFITGIMTFFIKEGRNLDSTYLTVLSIMITTFTVIIIPQIAYQKAIRELQPITVAMLLPLMPVMTYFIEFFDSRLKLTIYPIMGILAVFGITIVSASYRYYNENKISDLTAIRGK